VTPEQSAANAAMEDAIQRVAKAYMGPGDVQGVLGDWVVVAAETVIGKGDAADDTTAYNVLMTGGGISSHRALGLLKVGAQHINRGWLGDDDD